MPGFNSIKIKTARRQGNQVSLTIGSETLGGSIRDLGEFIRRLRHMHSKTMGAAPPAEFSERVLFTSSERHALKEAAKGSSFAAGMRQTPRASSRALYGKEKTYKITHVGVEGTQKGYAVYIDTPDGRKDVAYYHPKSGKGRDIDTAYNAASCTADSIKRGRWLGGPDRSRKIRGIRVKGRTATVTYD